jgi:hypothetical protein
VGCISSLALSILFSYVHIIIFFIFTQQRLAGLDGILSCTAAAMLNRTRAPFNILTGNTFAIGLTIFILFDA